MFWFVLVCGWGLTAAAIALVWIHVRPGRDLLVGLGIGALGGLLWPLTIWVAVGALFYTRAARRSERAPTDPALIAGKIQQAQAYAQQAEIEGMATSAQYWHAEAQRISAEQQERSSDITHPAATALIVLGSTIAALGTIGLLWFTAPWPEPVALATAPPPSTGQVPGGPSPARLDEPGRTELGNIAKRYGELARLIGDDGNLIAEFTLGTPTPATCNPYAQEPDNGRFIRLPISLKTYDDPTDQLVLLNLGSPWEYVSTDNRSLEASTSAAGSCAYDVPAPLGPNRNYDFEVVLDVPAAPGALVLNALFDDGGWEWSYPGS
ncbi:hypothetical protein [Pseudonocardia sp. MH-G8]|uniref:hypothetical protein n=1 Tax=Pseudonocardia sp. MH-G8 TaxID=1854588 RepID=UPI000B9FBAAD|nr:hypothetical protein [Pseudonocardia sp. MH-G8]OZM83507.1 hypothetical protein CFP66_03090 [Pseudonocardia sp. MH-G8]